MFTTLSALIESTVSVQPPLQKSRKEHSLMRLSHGNTGTRECLLRTGGVNDYCPGERIHLGNLGNAYHVLGQVVKAIKYYKQALDIAENRPMAAVTLRMPEDVVEDLKRIAPLLGFSGYPPLMRAYVGQALWDDLE